MLLRTDTKFSTRTLKKKTSNKLKQSYYAAGAKIHMLKSKNQ